MRKCYAIMALLAALALGMFAASALAGNGGGKPPAPPGQGECAHGNSGKPCKDDPQPEKGKDCEEHGKKGGVNEDHCKGTETTPTDTTPTETTPTTPEETTPSTTETTSTTPSPQETTPDEPSSDKPGTTPDSPSGSDDVTKPTLEEQLDEQAQQNGANTDAPGHPQAAGELPYTGFEVWMAVVIGLSLSGAGIALRHWAKP